MTTARPRLIHLAWPLLVELLLALVVGAVGTALAARMSDAAGGAFALASQISVSLFVLFRVIGAGVSVVITQNLGGGRRDEADRVALASVGASSWLGLFAGVTVLGGAGGLLALLQCPPEVLPLADPFLRALAPALMLDAWNASMAAVMRAHLRTRDTLAVLAAMHISHLLLTLPLMQGWGPLPALGLPGFALALAVSRALGLALHLMLWRRTLGLDPRGADWWRLARRPLAAILHIGLPGAAESILHRVCFMATFAVVGQLGAAALSTQAYVFQIQACIGIFGIAIGLAVEIMAGHFIGAGQLRRANRLVRRAFVQGLAATALLGVAAALAAPVLLGFFTRDPEILRLGGQALWLNVLVLTGSITNIIVINGLRAAGDVRYPLLVAGVSMPLVMALGGWLLAVHAGLGLPGLWLAYAADEWLRGLLMWRRWRRLGWVAGARGVRRRVRQAGGPA